MHLSRKVPISFLTGAGVILLWLPLFLFASEWPESRTATFYAEDPQSPYQPTEGITVREVIYQGISTRLICKQTLAIIPRHDMDLGRTTFVLESSDGKKVLLTETFKEVWECLGYNPRTHRYVLASQNERGAKVTLRGLVYLEETKPWFRESIFGQQQFEAVASLYSPDGTYLVLIGAPASKETYKLYALCLDTDQLRLIGAPPAPPPLTKEELEYPDAILMYGPWEAPERHYTKLGKDVWTFLGPHTLQVIYGKDTLKSRSKKRKAKIWNLKEVFN